MINAARIPVPRLCRCLPMKYTGMTTSAPRTVGKYAPTVLTRCVLGCPNPRTIDMKAIAWS
ncbi:MAG: hypothetical protein MOIL_01474 [Candidatus Methanolliviera sp. GoM_oil]|nr:MAG: hypothetical protein MOIL_01474 [Candidatus Methanolliviera sp. GoM_oil]